MNNFITSALPLVGILHTHYYPLPYHENTSLNCICYFIYVEQRNYCCSTFVIRSQTTKGIWIARCVGVEPCTVVLDLEGTDGRERGEVRLHRSITMLSIIQQNIQVVVCNSSMLLVVKLVLHSNYVKYGFSFFDLFSSQPRNLGSLNHASLRNDLYFDTNIICSLCLFL